MRLDSSITYSFNLLSYRLWNPLAVITGLGGLWYTYISGLDFSYRPFYSLILITACRPFRPNILLLHLVNLHGVILLGLLALVELAVLWAQRLLYRISLDSCMTYWHDCLAAWSVIGIIWCACVIGKAFHGAHFMCLLSLENMMSWTLEYSNDVCRLSLLGALMWEVDYQYWDDDA